MKLNLDKIQTMSQEAQEQESLLVKLEFLDKENANKVQTAVTLMLASIFLCLALTQMQFCLQPLLDKRIPKSV